ncbi:hypothetical protein IQ276_036305 [Desmonostoc muscorum LEGE 12446]|uniref:hypothetical protein n=1 Tax=Desmonostoc muscorum TaxID=1179 RepID=UPI001F3C2CC2|nr:hypothetical protein [Desmonostoc muscorum]MCF2151784.1 hypothetical protein [Desmonostoc muscorum LEGE 12446]
MTNSNQNHEFDYLNENSADSSPGFNSTNGNHRSNQATLVADDDISPEEEQLLAGYNPTANHLISEEYRLKQDAEGAVERPLAEKPSVRREQCDFVRSGQKQAMPAAGVAIAKNYI